MLGWDDVKKDGSFIPGKSPFEDVAGGKQLATNLVAQGADILLPVAGNSAEGALQVAKASNGKVGSMWVDTDGCVSQEKYCAVIPTSVGKAMDVAVFEAIKAAKDGQLRQHPLRRHPGQQRRLPRPVPQWESKVTRGHQGRTRQDQGRYHRRHDQGDLVTEAPHEGREAGPPPFLCVRGAPAAARGILEGSATCQINDRGASSCKEITKRFGTFVANDAVRP